MGIKKFLVTHIVLVFITLPIFAADYELAQFYLTKAYSFYRENKIEPAAEYLKKSSRYAQFYPEYYYLSNHVLPDDRQSQSLKEKNADKIIAYINNAYIIPEYDLLKQALYSFEAVRRYDECILHYKRLFQLSNINKEADYKWFINILYKQNPSDPLIPTLVKEARSLFHSVDYDYYLLLYYTLNNMITKNDFNAYIKVLEAHNYHRSKVLYLNVLYHSNTSVLKGFYREYQSLLATNNFSPGFKISIIYEFLKKNYAFNTSDIKLLLQEWKRTNFYSYKTVLLLRDKKLSRVIRENLHNFSDYAYLSGMFRKDTDGDGIWESIYEYREGKLRHIMNDIDQDGILEDEAFYDNREKLVKFIIFKSHNANKQEYDFNPNDYSLQTLTYITDNNLDKIITFKKSSYYPEQSQLKAIRQDTSKPYISHIEKWDKGYTFQKFNNGLLEYEFFDFNNNGIYEKKEYYQKGIINEVITDSNENHIFEMREVYLNGKISLTEYKTREKIDYFDYRELYDDKGITKQWDFNHDSIWEIKIVEPINGAGSETELKYFDINYDGMYDYLFESHNKKTIGIYRLDNKEQRTKLKSFNKEKIKNDYKWNIVTPSDPVKVPVPDDIIVQDFNNLSGIFYYNNKKYFFYNGIVKSNFFEYRLFYINDIVYLFDLQ